MGMWLVSFVAIVLWTCLAMISHTWERVSNLKGVGDCWGISCWNLGENAKLFPTVVRPIYMSTNNEGEETIFSMLAYMPGAMGRKEEKHSEREQVLRQILAVLIQIPGTLSPSPRTCPQPRGFAVRPPSLTLTEACLVAVCPQLHTAGKAWQVRSPFTPSHLLVTHPNPEPLTGWYILRLLSPVLTNLHPESPYRIRLKSPSRDPAWIYLHTFCFPAFPVLLPSPPSSFSWGPFLNKSLAKNGLRICFWRTQAKTIPRPMKTQVYDSDQLFLSRSLHFLHANIKELLY